MTLGLGVDARALCFANCLRSLVVSSGFSMCFSELAVYGSLVRGDFVENVSDVDVFYVINEYPGCDVERVNSMLERFGEVCVRGCGFGAARGVDVAWCYLSEVMAARLDVCNFKFLTLYRGDFDAHHMLVVGGRFHDVFPRVGFEEAFRLSVARISRRICEWANKPDLLRIAVGELAKLILAKQGYRGPWDKFSVLRELERRGLGRLASFWRLYITGRSPTPQDLIEAVEYAAGMAGLKLKCLRGRG